jgi:hypothetical protein
MGDVDVWSFPAELSGQPVSYSLASALLPAVTFCLYLQPFYRYPFTFGPSLD